MKTIALILLYLSLPLFIFWGGWFEWWVALPPTLVLGYFLFTFCKSSEIHLRSTISSIEITPLSACLLLALFWTYFAGVGGFRPQHFDYYKHNLIFNNLVRYQWPVRYADGSYLCYYHAYYLPPALLARWVGGMSYVHYFTFGWTWLGLGLLFTVLYRLNGWKLVFLFLFFNSPEAILLIYDAFKSSHFLHFLKDFWQNDHTVELIKSPGGLLFHSHVDAFVATPQHALPAWLSTAVLLKLWKEKSKAPLTFLPFALVVFLLYWSPLVAIGFLGLAFYLSFVQKTLVLSSFSSAFRLLFFVTLLAYPALIFYAGHVPSNEVSSWWWSFFTTRKDTVFLVVFIVLEISTWAVLIGMGYKNQTIFKRDFNLLLCTLFILLGLTLYRYGHFNDLARRASLPALMVICWGVSTLSFKKPWMIFTLVLCAVLPLKQQLRWFSAQPYSVIADKEIKDFTPYSIHYLSKYHPDSFDVTAQYLGKADASYLHYFAPHVLPKPKEVTRAFYYWKSAFQLKDYEKTALRRYGIQRLYVKFFDVDWDISTRQAVPKAAIRFFENPSLEVIPTVFITNRTLEKLSWGGVDELSKKIAEKVQNLNPFPLGEVQIDCDWSLATRAKYFRLLTQLKKNLPDSTGLSATIRLHQIKFYRTTGVPPVERGMLMYYNMDDWKNIKTENSILDLNVAGRYADYVSAYPLPLDVVLPVFRWAVVYRNGRFLRFVNHLTHKQLQSHPFFIKSPLPNAYTVVQNGTFLEIPVRRGDLFRVEESTLENLKISTQTLAQEIQNRKVTFALYHLDSLNLTYYAVPTARVFLPQGKGVQDPIQQLFQTFR